MYFFSNLSLPGLCGIKTGAEAKETLRRLLLFGEEAGEECRRSLYEEDGDLEEEEKEDDEDECCGEVEYVILFRLDSYFAVDDDEVE